MSMQDPVSSNYPSNYPMEDEEQRSGSAINDYSGTNVGSDYSGSNYSGDTYSQVRQKTGEAVEQAQEKAGEVVNTVKEQAVSQLSTQKEKAAEGLGSVAQAIRQTGDQLRQNDQSGVAEYVDKAAQGFEKFSNYLRERDLDEIVGGLERFARREPALFLGGAFTIGLLAARFLRSSAPRPSAQSSAASYGQSYNRSITYRPPQTYSAASDQITAPMPAISGDDLDQPQSTGYRPSTGQYAAGGTGGGFGSTGGYGATGNLGQNTSAYGEDTRL